MTSGSYSPRLRPIPGPPQSPEPKQRPVSPLQQPSFAAQTHRALAVAIQCDPSETEICNDQKPARRSTRRHRLRIPSRVLASCRRRPRPEDDPRRWFEDPDRPFELEIGSGKGTFLIQAAPHRPENNFLGIEWMMAFGHTPPIERVDAECRTSECCTLTRWNSSGNGSPARAFTLFTCTSVIRGQNHATTGVEWCRTPRCRSSTG